MTDEANILFEDGAAHLKFGEQAVTVKALNLASSLQWSKRVQRGIAEHASKTLSLVNNVQQNKEQSEQSAALVALLDNPEYVQDGAMFRDLLIEHTPSVLTLELLNGGTARQLSEAFMVVWRLENPFGQVARSLQAG